MRTLSNVVTSSAIAFAAADLATGATPAFGDTGVNSNVAAPAKRASKPARKLSGKATGKAKAGKQSKPGAKPVATKAKPVSGDVHGLSNTYRGASPVFRGHAHKLSPIVLDRIPGTYTDRDAAALKALYAKHGTKPFGRFDLDAGVAARLIGFGYVKLASGQPDERTCTLAITAKAVAERFKRATA